MAVAFDAATEHIKNADPDSYSHAGAVSGVKGSVLAIVNLDSSTNIVTQPSYGGVNYGLILRAADATSETGSAELWFLGTGVPQGTQTVLYGNTGTANAMWSCCVTLTGAADLEVIDSDLLQDNQTNPSNTLGYSARTAIALAALFSGHNAEAGFTVNGNTTLIHSVTNSTRTGYMMRQTTPGTSDFAIGGTATAEDCAFVSAAISEVGGGGGGGSLGSRKSLTGVGRYFARGENGLYVPNWRQNTVFRKAA